MLPLCEKPHHWTAPDAMQQTSSTQRADSMTAAVSWALGTVLPFFLAKLSAGVYATNHHQTMITSDISDIPLQDGISNSFKSMNLSEELLYSTKMIVNSAKEGSSQFQTNWVLNRSDYELLMPLAFSLHQMQLKSIIYCHPYISDTNQKILTGRLKQELK